MKNKKPKAGLKINNPMRDSSTGKLVKPLIKTYTLNWGDGDLIGTNIEDALLSIEGDNFNPADHECGVLKIMVTVERKYTQDEIDKLPEFGL